MSAGGPRVYALSAPGTSAPHHAATGRGTHPAGESMFAAVCGDPSTVTYLHISL